MAKISQKWPKMALSGLWSPERLEQVRKNVGTGCSPSGLITINPLQHKKRPNFVSRRSQNGHYWLKMAQNDTFEALEPRKAGTSWNKYWNRLLTIKTDHYEPISAQGKAKFRVKKVQKWPKIAKHGTANAVLGHFGLKWLF